MRKLLLIAFLFNVCYGQPLTKLIRKTASGGGGGGNYHSFNLTSGTITESPSHTYTMVGSSYMTDSDIALGGDGYSEYDYSTSSGIFIYGLDASSSNTFWNPSGTFNYSYGFYVASGTIYCNEAGTSAGSPTSAGSASGVTNFRLDRTGTAVTLQKSTDNKGSWSTVYTFSASSTGNLYAKVSAFNPSVVVNAMFSGFL